MGGIGLDDAPAAPSHVPATAPSHVPPPRPPRPTATSRRVWRNRFLFAATLVVLATLVATALRGAGDPAAHGGRAAPSGGGGHAVNPRLDPDWQGSHVPITLVFGGDVNFPVGSLLADRLAADPSSALGTGARRLLGHADLSMVNLETALTFGGCPVPQPKEFVFWAPPTALTAVRDAGATLVTEANNHGEDCGLPGLRQALTIRARAHCWVIGIGADAQAAYASYQTVLDGEHVGIIAATQVIDSDLVDTWTATNSRPGLASAYETQALINAVEAARRVDDTVVVFLHWGVQLDPCPDPIQEPLAEALVRAGADVVVGSHAHVLLGAGYLGTALVDYGLGNFAFYNDPSPTNLSGALAVTITGRHVDAYAWRPAIIENELPIAAAGAAARLVQSDFEAARGCTDLTPRPGRPLASPSSEVSGLPPALAHELT